jgi:hypothetical protein
MNQSTALHAKNNVCLEQISSNHRSVQFLVSKLEAIQMQLAAEHMVYIKPWLGNLNVTHTIYGKPHNVK